MKQLLAILFLLSIFLTPQLQAQTGNGDCGYVPDKSYIDTWKNPKSIQNQRLQHIKKYPLKEIYKMEKIQFKDNRFRLIKPSELEIPKHGPDLNIKLPNPKRYIPIVAQIVRRSDNSGGLSRATLDDAIETLNEKYNHFNMYFTLCEVKYINNTTLYNNAFDGQDDDDGTANASYNRLNVRTNNVARKLNMYFVPNSTTSWAWRPTTNMQKQHILFLNSQVSNGSTMSHEVGHWFGLLHTHGSDRTEDELVDGSNCATAGDFICDTPADPKLSNRVDVNCNYTGGPAIVDDNGDRYNPDTRNIMSYSHKPCRNRFSQGQIYSMQSAYLGMDTDRGYTFQNCLLSTIIFDKKWSIDWTIVDYFRVSGKPYLFLLKKKTGDVHIHKVNKDGTPGTRVLDAKWSAGWSTAKFYTVKEQTYLFLLKEGTGDVHVHKMNGDGKVGAKIIDTKWSAGWSNAEFYTAGTQTYLFLLKAKTGDVHIHQIGADGKIGKQTTDKKWSTGWTTTKTYKIGSKTYLFLLKAGTGDVHIHQLSGGVVGTKITDTKWNTGWTVAEIYRSNGKFYAMFIKSATGQMHLHRVNSDGKIGKRVQTSKWSSGWTNLAIDSEPILRTSQTTTIGSFGLLLKAKTGDVHIHQLN